MITQKLPPGPGRLMDNLSNMGYDLNTSITDIIDNSIYWKAKNIHVEIVPKQNGTESHIFVIDDGNGMSEAKLIEGMRYSSEREYKADDLGKFGLGLKTASLSHCDVLTVYTKAKNSPALIARWDKNFVREKGDWLLQRPDEADLKPFEKNLLQNIKKKKSGTIVCWTQIKNFSHLENIDKNENKIIHEEICKDLSNHIGMVYHEIRKVIISVQGIDVAGWDPFCRNEKTKKLKKAIFRLKNEPSMGSLIKIHPFILPRKDEFSSLEAWKEASGPAKWNNQQGFYFYRNGRLISSGGWANCKGRSEEHNKLLRIMVDFKSCADKAVQVNIEKSNAIIPLEIRAKILEKLRLWRGIAANRYNSAKSKKKNSKSKKALKVSFAIGQHNLLYAKNKLVLTSSKNIIKNIKNAIKKKNLKISQIAALCFLFAKKTIDKNLLKIIINEK